MDTTRRGFFGGVAAAILGTWAARIFPVRPSTLPFTFTPRYYEASIPVELLEEISIPGAGAQRYVDLVKADMDATIAELNRVTLQEIYGNGRAFSSAQVFGKDLR